jgi:urease accessory protein
MPTSIVLYAFVALTVCAIAADPSFAHEERAISGEFSSGFTHPFRGVDHLLAMIAVGLWGAVLRRPLIYILPLVFPTVMAVGGVLGMAGVPVPPVEVGIALSVLILGILVAAGRALPIWAAASIVGTFAIFHGYAHGQELPLAADPISYSVGFVLATGLLHLLGIAVGALGVRGGALRQVPRLLGGAIAMTGIYFLLRAAAG